jgi:hypothetical protein
MYTVIWRVSALDALANVYVQANPTDRARMASAIASLNSRLKDDPLAEGESRSGGNRIAFLFLFSRWDFTSRKRPCGACSECKALWSVTVESQVESETMTPFAKRTLAICLLTAGVETILVLTKAKPVVLLFVLGPPVFLAVIVWRRRTHPIRTRRLATVALATGAFGIAALAVASYQARLQPNPEKAVLAPLAVPLVQWVLVLFVWISLAREESREKREKTGASS